MSQIEGVGYPKALESGHDGIEILPPAKNVNAPTDSEVGSQFVSKDLATSYEVDAFAVSQAAKDGDYVEFRSMGWIQAGLIGTAEAIALGLLSYPSIYLRLGMVGGIIATIGLGILSYITGCMMVDFKVRHMGVMHYGDVGSLMFGKWGRYWFGAGLVLKCAGLGGSHVLVGETALNYISSNAICAVWFGFIIAVVSIFMSVNREWGKLHFMSTLSLVCICVASLIIVIATGVQSPSVLVKKGVPISWHAFPTNPNLADVVGGLTNIVFGYGGNIAVLSLCSEMKKPNDYKKSLMIVQGSQIFWYCLVGALVYSFGGQYTVSPALTMAVRKISIAAYVLALITILVSGILGVNVAAKYLYMETLRGSPLLTSKGWRAWSWWMALVSILWIVGFIVAELIPFFNQLLTIISSVFSVWFIFGYVGVLWFYDNHPALAAFAKDEDGRRDLSSWKQKGYYFIAVFSIALSIVITPLGLYSAAEGIKSGYANSTFKHPFSC